YSFYQRARETDTHRCSERSPALTLTTASALSGTILVSGEARFGKTLVASFTNTNNSGVLSYTWKRGAMTVGIGETYAVQAVDIGNQLSVEVTSSVQHGSVTRIIGTAQKAEYIGAAPEAPTRLARTSSSITLTPLSGYEYSRDGRSWQSNNRFTGLAASTTYSFYQRVAASATMEASAASEAVRLSTAAASAGGTGGSSDDGGGTDGDEAEEGVTTLYSLTLTGDNTRVLSTALTGLIRGNQTRDVTIKLDNASFTFFQGTMQAIPGQLWYDFGVTINGCIHEQAAGAAAGEGYVATIHYNYEGELPASANIRLWLGSMHAGKTLYYYRFDPVEKTLEYMQSAVVDSTGWVTVVQESCSDYVFTQTAPGASAATPTPDMAALTPTPTAEPTATPAVTTARTAWSGWVLALIIAAALLFIIGGIWLYMRNRDE
ncbi:MAG: hypothetical protein Q4C13_08890, partial [Clostridia bacterium]|nr:hypothetical protein [Clostridia bacterium]